MAVSEGQRRDIYVQLEATHGEQVAGNIMELLPRLPHDELATREDLAAHTQRLRGEITQAIAETIADPVHSVPTAFRKIVESQAPEQGAMKAKIESLENRLRMLANEVSSAKMHLSPWSAKSSILLPAGESAKESLDLVKDWIKAQLAEGNTPKGVARLAEAHPLIDGTVVERLVSDQFFLEEIGYISTGLPE